MRGRLSSPRFRRRLGWLAILVLVAGLITLAATKYANTGASNATPLIDKPATVYRIPARMHLSKQDRNDLFDVTSRFVRTAVARKHLDSAWNMLGPELKAGQTHKSWDTGFNNVVPFKADGIGLFSILYAYQNDVAIDTGLVSGKGSGWAAKTFTIELKRYPGQPHHWLVASWVPKGIGGGGTLSPSRRAGPPPPPFQSKLSARWLLVPLVFFALLVVFLTTWALGGAIRGRRAARRYADALGYSSSSNPS
jgi:hypothetical protein